MKSFRDFGIDLPDTFKGDRKILCPKCSAERQHHRNEPCLSVNGEKQLWNCHHCGWTGCLKDGRDYYDKSSVRHEEPEIEYRKPDPSIIRNAIDPQIQKYFAGRGIFMKALQTAGVYSTMHWLPGTGCETLCMAFPYYKDGELVNVKYRDANKNMSQEKDPLPMLWNIDNCKEADMICICEGEIDALTLIECGIMSATSVDKGAPQVNDRSADKKLECVANCLELIQNIGRVVICSDKDEPGLRLERELISLIGPEHCKVAHYPDGCKDLNETLCKFGKEEVLRAVDTAVPAPVPGIHRFSDFADDIMDMYQHGVGHGLTTGWPEMDMIYTLQTGSMNVITGIPESGKTEFVHALMMNTIYAHNWRWGIYSPEMMPVKNLFMNFAEKYVGKSFFGPKENRMSQNDLQRAMAVIDHSIYPVVPDENVICNLENILDMFRVMIVRDHINGCIIDPWNELENATPQGVSATEYVGLCLQKVVRFARAHNVWFGIVAHPTKLKKDEKTGQYPVANLYDVNGSANFYNKADSGLSLWRDRIKRDNVVQVNVLKVKNKNIGKSGTSMSFLWRKESGRFSPTQVI